jgi:hypothetical protein
MIMPLLVFAAQAATRGAVGGAQCGTCHPREVATFGDSPMTRAAQRPADSPFLKNNSQLPFHIGRFTYSVKQESGSSAYSVTDGANTLSGVIGWAIGKGVVGQTWLVERAGVLYEGAVSYYPSTKALDLTPGHAELPRNTLEEAFGRKLDSSQAAQCFGCHATDAVWKGAAHPETWTPGVQCWQCHSKALQHAAAMKTGTNVQAARMQHLGGVSPEDLAVVCAKCHPSWADVAAKGPRGVLNVRMQFYRLTNSRCYDSADSRISCTACHNPHGNLSNDQASYESRCRACHYPASSASPKAPVAAKKCPIATTNCIACHMPKVEIPGLHYQFTDHEIRIVRKGDKYPD